MHSCCSKTECVWYRIRELLESARVNDCAKASEIFLCKEKDNSSENNRRRDKGSTPKPLN